MGICSTTKTVKIVIEPQRRVKINVATPVTYSHIGLKFQEEIEEDQSREAKDRAFKKLLQELDQFSGDPQYIQLRNKCKNTIVEFTIIESRKLDVRDLDIRDEDILNWYLIRELKGKELCQQLLKGSTPKYRWPAWMAQTYVSSTYYDHNQPDHANEEQIRKDINRTLPNFDHFRDDQPGQQQLFSILRALSLQFPEIGYVQGMNQLVAFTLIVNGGNEEQSFQFMCNMARHPKFQLLDLYKTQFQYVKLLIDIFHDNFKATLPGLHEHFEYHGVMDQQYIWQWVLTMFIYHFPFAAVLRFWDFILSKDILAIIQLAISILRNYGSYLISYDMESIQKFFQNLRNTKISPQDLEEIVAFANNLVLQIGHRDNIYSDHILNGFKIEPQPEESIRIENID